MIPKFVYSVDGKRKGAATGGRHNCPLEGCRGQRIAVRWANGKMTYPCSQGMVARKDGNWQIIE